MTTFETIRAINKAREAEKKIDGLMYLVSFPFLCGVDVFNYWLCGRVLKQMWDWFVTPAFGIPSPRIVFIVGIALMVGTLRIGHSIDLSNCAAKESSKGDTERAWVRALTYTLAALLSLGVAWIIHLFV